MYNLNTLYIIKEYLSKYAKFRHHNTVIKSECLCEAETLTLNKRMTMKLRNIVRHF